VEVEALNADPTPIEDLTLPAVIEHLESVVSQIDPTPILMGHSAGGVFTQLLMDRATAPPASRSTRRRPRASSACRCRRSGRASPSSRTPPTGTRPSGSPSSNGATCSRTRSARRRREGCTSATTSPRRAACSGAVRSRTSIRGPTTRTWTTRTPTGRHCSSSLAARITSCPVDPALEREALQGGRHDHRGRRVRRPRAPHALADRLGGDRRLRSVVGDGAGRRVGGATPSSEGVTEYGH
jgi:hypothetical protein